MNNKLLLTKALVAVATVFLATTVSFGQCVIPITDNQPYFEDFEADGFDCWTVETVGGGNWTLLEGTQTTLVAFSSDAAGDEARLVSPVFNLSGVGAATFSFTYAMIGIYQVDELDVCYRSSETDSWHVMGTFSLSDPTNYYEATCELENLSDTYQISFLGRSHGGMYIFVDNIEIASVAGCNRPLNLEVTDVTAFTALLGWSTNGNEESWTVELDGVETTVEEQPYLLDHLMPQTTYTFRVRANCGGGSTSEWSTAYSFTTLCDVFVVTDDNPYRDDFEASEDFLCWQSEIVWGDDNWVVDPGYTIPNNTAFFIWLGGQARLVSMPLDLTAVTRPTLDFKHRQPQGQYGVDELAVMYRTSEDASWVLIENYLDATAGWRSETLELPNPSATYQIAFVGTSNGTEGVYVDDVAVGAYEVVGIADQSAFEVAVSPNPTNGKVMVETGDQNGEVAVFDTMGRQIATATVAEGHAEIDLSHCAKGVYVARIVTITGTKTVKLVKE